MNNQSFYNTYEAEYFANRTDSLTLARGSGAAFLDLYSISERAGAIVQSFAAQGPSAHLPALYDETATLGFAKQDAILLKLLHSTDAAVYGFPFNGGSFFANAVERPASRGTIILNATDPPDVDLAVEKLTFTRRYQDTPSIRSLGAVELVPGRDYTTDAKMECVMRESLYTSSFAHWCGGIPTMPLEYGGVVSTELLVYWTKKLSVVGSSIMPMVVATHLQAITYAIAEKAADLINARNGWMKREY